MKGSMWNGKLPENTYWLSSHFQISLKHFLLWFENKQEIMANSDTNSLSMHFYIFTLWGIFKCEEYVFSKTSLIVFWMEKGVSL